MPLEITIPAFKKSKSVKDMTISILASEWPLSTKQIYNRVKKTGLSVSYQAVHKSLKELLEKNVIEKKRKKYKISLEWGEQLRMFGEKIESLYKTGKVISGSSSVGEIRFYTSPDDFYKNLIRMCKEYSFLRLASKTPALILSKEFNLSPYRKEYYTVLMQNISKNKLKVNYLFSTELTKQLIVKERDIKALNRLEGLIENKNIKVKHAPLYTVITMAISVNEYMIGFPSPAHTDLVGFLHVISKNTQDISKIYDNVFSNAFEPLDMIQEIKKELYE